MEQVETRGAPPASDEQLPARPGGDSDTVARGLLRAAGLTMSPTEADRLCADHAGLRARADALYAIGGDSVQPALGFDPTWT